MKWTLAQFLWKSAILIFAWFIVIISCVKNQNIIPRNHLVSLFSKVKTFQFYLEGYLSYAFLL
ncbi:hypothetical protein ACH0B6_14130 [Solibacillus silvestris]